MSRTWSLIFAALCVVLPVAHGLYLRPNQFASVSAAFPEMSDEHIALLDAGGGENTHKDNPFKHVKDALDKAGKTGSRPLMNTINVMRAEFCLRRPDLLQHEKCLKFLLEKCTVQTSGYGYCTEYHEILEKACDEGKVLPGEKKKCDYHDQLHAAVDLEGHEQSHIQPTEEPPPETTTTAAPTTAAPTTVAPTTVAPAEAPEAQEIEKEAAPEVEDDDSDAEGEGKGDDGGADAAASAPASATPVAPGPSPGAPGPGPAPLPPAHAVVSNFDKKWRDLPEQGFDEHSDPKWVQHKDFDTQTADWQSEWPRWDETEGQSTDRICEDRPDHLWCKLWLKDRASRSQVSGRSSADSQEIHHENSPTENAENAQENVEESSDATGDQFSDALDQASDSLPPGMSPTDKDLKDDHERKMEGVSDSGQDLPPGMLTHPDDYDDKDKLAFKAELMDSASPEIHIDDDDDFASDDANYDDPETVDESLEH